ncbi:MAG: diadenylate cyclase [Caldilineaceae bacterium]
MLKSVNVSKTVMSEAEMAELLCESICAEDCGINRYTLERVIGLAVEIAREGREGRKIGTLFVVGDTEATLKHSRCLILDPLWHHPPEKKRIDDPNMRETIKELAQLDGAFIVSNAGTVVSACRYVSASAEGVELPLGLGSRHMAAASITKETAAMAVVVSESAVVRIFDDGELISEVIPELWMLRRYGLQLAPPYSLRKSNEVTIASKRPPNPAPQAPNQDETRSAEQPDQGDSHDKHQTYNTKQDPVYDSA